MLKIDAENYDYEIHGYVSNLNIQKSNRNSMITLVNNRVVTNQSVNRTIKDAYFSSASSTPSVIFPKILTKQIK